MLKHEGKQPSTYRKKKQGQNKTRTRTSLRAEIPQHNDRLLSLLDRPALDRMHKVVLRIERARLAREPEALFSCDLRDRAARGEVAFQDATGTNTSQFRRSPSIGKQG